MQNLKRALREGTSPANIKRDLALMNRIQRVYMFVIMAVTVWAFVYTGDYSSSGWTSLITGLVLAFYLIMLASGRLTNFFWGLLMNGIWLLMSIHNHLVGDILNQGFFFVMQFVGIAAWYKQLSQQADHSQIQAKRIGPKMMGCLVAGAVVYGIVLTVAKTAHGNQVYLDSSQLPLGMLAKFWQRTVTYHNGLYGCSLTLWACYCGGIKSKQAAQVHWGCSSSWLSKHSMLSTGCTYGLRRPNIKINYGRLAMFCCHSFLI